MSSLPRCALVVPIYNEEKVIQNTIERLQKIIAPVQDFTFEIVCVDDGSKDRSLEILKKIPGITVLHHPVNRGYGAALRSGLDFSESDWIFIVDADGTYPLEDLPKFLREAKEDTEMVVGHRQGAGIQSRIWHRMARWILRKMVHALTGVMVPDLNSGMRIFRRSLYRQFRHLLPMGFSFTTTLTVASLYSGYRIHFFPIEYSKRIGKSNIRPVRDFFAFTMLILRLASYFDPLRFFVPLAYTMGAIGILRGLRDIWVVNGLGSLSVILLIFALQLFGFGILADVMVRRAQADGRGPERSGRHLVIKTES